jgi:hypothetical protein
MPTTRHQDARPVYVIDRNTEAGVGYFGPNSCRLITRALRAQADRGGESPEAARALRDLALVFASVWRPEAGHPDA